MNSSFQIFLFKEVTKMSWLSRPSLQVEDKWTPDNGDCKNNNTSLMADI